jgi:hypothetical protein
MNVKISLPDICFWLLLHAQGCLAVTISYDKKFISCDLQNGASFVHGEIITLLYLLFSYQVI